MLKIKEYKGITLIALVVSIIVLLILAGVTINAITGNESAMEKATEAREKNDQGAELDAINLAVVNSIASDLTGLVNVDALKQGLTGLVKGNLDTIIDQTKTEWEVEGNTGRLYKITNRGTVEIASTVNITKDGEIVTVLSYNSDEIELNTTTIQLNATSTPDLTINSVTWESGTPTVASIDNTGLVTLKDKGSTTITLTANTTGGNFTKSCTINIIKSLEIGDSINYSTMLNEQILNDWKVFYIDRNYTYIILDNYLPRAAINNAFKTTYNLAAGNGDSYTIKSTTNRADLINAMITTSDWSDLINNGKMNGVDLSSTIKNNDNVWAMGAPRIDLWTNSWNSESNEFTTKMIPSEGDYDGDNINNYTTLSIPSEDKNKAKYSLYFPNADIVDSCYGYWLASPSASYNTRIVLVKYKGDVSFGEYSSALYAFRPVICLPSSVFE